MSSGWREFTEGFPEFSEDVRWVGYLAAGSALTFIVFSSYVFGRLIEVRPLLVFVSVDGRLPPVCGLCVLFGA
jgi:hypothetical protein